MIDACEHTFVVLAHRESPFLRGCLASLGAQTRASRIVVSTSTPCSHIDAAAKAAGCELLINPEREGIGADWNFGLRLPRTRFVTLAHQDDLYAPEFVEKTLQQFARQPEGRVCFTGYREIDDAGRPRGSKISAVKHLLEAAIIGRREAIAPTRLRWFLAFGNPLPCSSVTFDLGGLPGFAFSTSLQSNLDWDAWWRLAEDQTLFLHVAEKLVDRRHNALTATSQLIASGQRRREDEAMFRRIWGQPLSGAVASLYRAGY